MSMTTSRGHRVVAALGSVALGLVGLVGVSTAANAADTANIDAEQASTATIHIHKSDADPADSSNKGAQVTPAPTNGLPGVTFTIEEVLSNNTSIDLTTTEGWEAAKAIYDAGAATDLPEGYGFGTGTDVVTNSNGDASYTPRHFGLFRVTEKDAGTNNVTTKAQPFYVTLPFNGGEGAWLYDVYTYPKNVVEDKDVTKSVEEQTAESGFVLPDGTVVTKDAEVTWTITVPIRFAESYTKVEVADALDANLEYKSAILKYGETELDGTDWSWADSKFALTDAGLTKLAELAKANPNKDLVITLTTKVVGDAAGVQANSVKSFVNDYTSTSNSPSTNWGKLEITKVETGTDNTLAGAEFTIYKGTNDEGTKIGTYTTDAAGKITVTLWVGIDGDTTEDYYLVETKAPAGYAISAQPQTVKVSADETALVKVTVENSKVTSPQLPLTGANGQLLMTIGGISLVLLASGVVLVSRKKHSEE